MQSEKGKLNWNDIKQIAKWTAIFFAAPVLMYLAQLEGQLDKGVITTLIPNANTIGAIEGWALGILINFFLSLKEGK